MSNINFQKVSNKADGAVEAVRRNSANIAEFQGRIHELIIIEKREVRWICRLKMSNFDAVHVVCKKFGWYRCHQEPSG
jgi:hypothetical protein